MTFYQDNYNLSFVNRKFSVMNFCSCVHFFVIYKPRSLAVEMAHNMIVKKIIPHKYQHLSPDVFGDSEMRIYFRKPDHTFPGGLNNY